MLQKLAIESVFATALVFAVMGLFSLIPLNFSALQPLENAIEGFDMMDLYYSEFQKDNGAFSKNVVLVNIADANRQEIAQLVEYIGFGEPAAIGIDVYFGPLKEYKSDSLLSFVLKSTPNVILGGEYLPDNNVILESNGHFKASAVGYTNFIGEDARSSTIRAWVPSIARESGEYQSFALQIARSLDKDAAVDFQLRSSDEEIINYIGNYEAFLHFEKEELLNGSVDPEIFRGKAVVVGYMGNSFNDQWNVEDKLYTPLNSKISGRTFPDMNGAIIHANAVEMIANRNWINQSPPFFTTVFTVLLTYFHVIFYMFLILKWDLYFDAIAKILQIISTLILLFFVFNLYHNTNYRMHVTGGLAGIAFAVDVLFIYEAVANSLYRKFKWKSILINEE